MQNPRYNGAVTGLHETLVYEHMLLSRAALQGMAPHEREFALDRSATVLLSRLEASGPMSVGELAAAFELDVSTVHRQVAAAMKAGLIERIPDVAGGAARTHRPTADGARRLREELDGREGAVRRVTTDWTDDELATFAALLRKFNRDVETLRGQAWPRPEEAGSA